MERQGQDNGGAANVIMSAERLQNIEVRVESLKQMVKAVEAAQSNSGQQSSPHLPTISNKVIWVSDPEQPQVKPTTLGHLSKQGGGRARYVEPSFWASLCEHVAELDELIYAQARHSASPAMREGHSEPEGLIDDSLAPYEKSHMQQSLHYHMASQGPAAKYCTIQSAQGQLDAGLSAGLVGIIQELPPKEQCDRLLECYTQGYHPMVPLIHVASFRRRYAIFWESWNNLATASPSMIGFASLILAICYAGSVAFPRAVVYTPRTETSSQDLSENLRTLTVKALRLSHFPRAPTLDSFRAYLICQSTTIREEEPLNSIAFVGLALRVANMLGLHRDPSHHPKMDLIEAEERRRCWWHLIHLDVLLAIASGLPPIVDLESWDVQQISEYNDDLIGTTTATQCEVVDRSSDVPLKEGTTPQQSPNQSHVSVAGILAGAKLRYSCRPNPFHFPRQAC